MKGESSFDFREVVRALHARGVRFLVFGRQAMRALGSPVHTQDYDVWFDRNARGEVMAWLAGEGFELTHAPIDNPPIVKAYAGADRMGAWFVRGMVNRDGVHLDFDSLYARSEVVGDPAGLWFRVPSVDDMILLKRMGEGVRPKDEEDIRFLLVLQHLLREGTVQRYD